MAVRAAKPSPGRPRRFAEAVGWRRLPCGARSQGLVANSLRANPCGLGAAFKQSRRSQSTRRAARAGHGPCAPRRLRGASQPARARLCGSAGLLGRNKPGLDPRQAAPGRGDFCGDEEHSAGVGARSALRELTRRYCLNVAPVPQGLARSELSARPRREHHSGVDAKRRPPQHEPLPGAAWRDALNAQESGCSSMSAMRRSPTLKSTRLIAIRYQADLQPVLAAINSLVPGAYVEVAVAARMAPRQ